MSARIFQFVAKGGLKPHHRKTDMVVLSTHDIFHELCDNIHYDLINNLTKNSVNSYFENRIPSYCKLKEGTNYTSDLFSISQVEQKLNMKIIVQNDKNLMIPSWMASFYFNDELFETKYTFQTECLARAFNVLAFYALCVKCSGNTAAKTGE